MARHKKYVTMDETAQNPDIFFQASFFYDSKKSGDVTGDFTAILKSEVRYSVLLMKYSTEIVDDIFAA